MVAHVASAQVICNQVIGNQVFENQRKANLDTSSSPNERDAAPIDLRTGGDLNALSTSRLESLVDEIDQRLQSLAEPSMRPGVGSVGYRSPPHIQSNISEWVRISWDTPSRIDQIVLVPTIWRNTQTGFQADGFPVEFRVVAGADDDSEGTTVSTFSGDENILPRVAPLVIPCSVDSATWVKIEASVLSSRAWDGLHVLQFSEIGIFDGEENVAIGQRVSSSSNQSLNHGARGNRFLVDGFVPYLMDAQQGDQSIAFVSNLLPDSNSHITIDLSVPRLINRVHFHATDVSDTVPQSVPTGFGVPNQMRMIGALEPDFSDAVDLVQYDKSNIYDVGPIIVRRFSPTRCRYIRLTFPEPYFEQDTETLQVGFAEVEVFENGVNVALESPVTANFTTKFPSRSLSAITDGNNFYGRILSSRDWMEQLAERHDLETLRPKVASELNTRYLSQKTLVNRLLILAFVLGFAVLTAVLIGWVLQARAVLNTRERIAADLHDELGANIHAIGLLSDLASAAADSPEKLKSLMARMRALTERTGAAAAYCANTLDSGDLYGDLPSDMRRYSDRVMVDIFHEIVFEGEEHLEDLNARKRIDLFLFYKECLTNIIRHSLATKASTVMQVHPNSIQLVIKDNGCGVASSKGATKAANGVPPSLKRRAKLLGAKLSVDQHDDGGTSVRLVVKMNRLRKAMG